MYFNQKHSVDRAFSKKDDLFFEKNIKMFLYLSYWEATFMLVLKSAFSIACAGS